MEKSTKSKKLLSLLLVLLMAMPMSLTALATEDSKGETKAAVETICFEGMSLRTRTDGSYGDYAMADFRFGYTINLPIDRIVNCTWEIGLISNAEEKVQTFSVDRENLKYTDNGDSSITANLVITGIPQVYFQARLYAKLKVTYTDEQGAERIEEETVAHERTVRNVAKACAVNSEDPGAGYASGLLDAIAMYEVCLIDNGQMYESLAGALAAAEAEDTTGYIANKTAVIEVLQDIAIEEIQEIGEGSHITLIDDGEKRTIGRGNDYTDVMFDVPAGAELTLDSTLEENSVMVTPDTETGLINGTALEEQYVKLALSGNGIASAKQMITSAGTLNICKGVGVVGHVGANHMSAINVTGGNLTVGGGYFGNNAVVNGTEGSVLYANGCGKVVICNAYFVKNSSNGYTGVYQLLDLTDTATFTNCWFQGNTAVCNIGVGLVKDTTATMANCDFIENEANGAGALQVSGTGIGGKVTLTECRFKGNEAKGNRTAEGGYESNITRNSLGGAIVIAEKGSLTATTCTFTGNKAGSDTNPNPAGGAIYFNTSESVTFSSCNFNGNLAQASTATGKSGRGGAISNYDGTAVGTLNILNGCTFNENVADLRGGAISVHSGVALTISNDENSEKNTFTGNKTTESSSTGGAIVFNPNANGTATITGIFEKNETSMTTSGLGGAIASYAGAMERCVIKDSTFIGNKGGYGGAIGFSSSGHGTLENCEFAKNEALSESRGSDIAALGSKGIVRKVKLLGKIGSTDAPAHVYLSGTTTGAATNAFNVMLYVPAILAEGSQIEFVGNAVANRYIADADDATIMNTNFTDYFIISSELSTQYKLGLSQDKQRLCVRTK